MFMEQLQEAFGGVAPPLYGFLLGFAGCACLVLIWMVVYINYSRKKRQRDREKQAREDAEKAARKAAKRAELLAAQQEKKAQGKGTSHASHTHAEKSAPPVQAEQTPLPPQEEAVPSSAQAGQSAVPSSEETPE